MKTLLPRLLVGDATAAKLKGLAEEHGVNVGDVIAAIVESRLNNEPRQVNETLFRLILVGERFGLSVGGAAAYPSDWVTVGRLTTEECSEIAADYLAWRRERNANARKTTSVP